MNEIIKSKIIEVCDEKISKKGDTVGLSFYAFFENKNKDPETLMNVARWWIEENRFDHFEKAVKIKKIVQRNSIKF